MSAADRLDRLVLGTPGLKRLVDAYYTPSRGFAADTFDTLGDNDHWAITRDDLLALTMLDVSLPPLAVRGLLDENRATAAAFLADIDPDIDIWKDKRRDSIEAAGAMWTWLQREEFAGVGTVIAGKLLARKRPRLIPIVDAVVVDTLRAGSGTYWESLAEALADDARRHRVDHLLPRRLSTTPSTLRLLDVAIWMRGSRSRRARRTRQEFDVPEPRYRRSRS